MRHTVDKKTLNLIKESNKFGVDDRLSSLINRSSELSESELELVAAAASPDYNKFKSIIDRKS